MKNSDKAKIPLGEADAGGDFENSLKEFGTEAALTSEAEKKRRNKRIFNIVIISFIAVCAAVLVVCIFLIVGNLSDKERGEEVYNDAASMFDPTSILNSDDSQTAGDAAPKSLYDRIKDLYDGNLNDDGEGTVDMSNIRASLSSLKQINDDVVGWIYVENTKINYPLMRSTNGDDDYYLTHAYNGEYLSVGSIYMVSSCDPKPDNNYNTLIYGHNVVNGSMFHDVLTFLDPEFFTTNIYIYTLDGVYVYQPFSIYQTQSDYNYIQTQFGSEKEFLDFAAEMKANSAVSSNVTVGEGDTMITLSTCINGGFASKARYSLHAKLIDIIN